MARQKQRVEHVFATGPEAEAAAVEVARILLEAAQRQSEEQAVPACAERLAAATAA